MLDIKPNEKIEITSGEFTGRTAVVLQVCEPAQLGIVRDNRLLKIRLNNRIEHDFVCESLVMKLAKALLVMLSLGSTCDAQQFDGIARMVSTSGEIWSGAVVGDGKLLTVAHPQSKSAWIELESTDGQHRLSVYGTQQRSDKSSDVALWSFKRPEWASVRVYNVADSECEQVSIYGYAGKHDRLKFDRHVKRRDQHLMITTGRGLSGMSGSPVFDGTNICGMQHSRTETETLCATPLQIRTVLDR